MRRFGQIIGIKPEHIEEYERLHADVWPGVLKTIEACNIKNYSIYRYHDTLFAYFEYHGDDFDADMAKMAADETTQKWWAVCNPMQNPVSDRAEDEWWKTLNEVFHTD
jgi:L-rhamnose mutarotase